jgi:hypothetical protein
MAKRSMLTPTSLANKEKNIALEQIILQCYDRLLRSAVSPFRG